MQRALETESEAILVAKQGTDGIYDRDPQEEPEQARRYRTLNYRDVLQNDLKVMDQSALLLARDHHLLVHVFDFDGPGAIRGICEGKKIGTTVGEMGSEFDRRGWGMVA